MVHVTFISDGLLNLVRRQPHHLNQKLKILLRLVCLKENFFIKELCDDATNGPHIDSCGVVVLIIQVQFGCTVVTSGHILGKVVLLVNVFCHHIGLPEV